MSNDTVADLDSSSSSSLLKSSPQVHTTSCKKPLVYEKEEDGDENMIITTASSKIEKKGEKTESRTSKKEGKKEREGDVENYDHNKKDCDKFVDSNSMVEGLEEYNITRYDLNTAVKVLDAVSAYINSYVPRKTSAQKKSSSPHADTDKDVTESKTTRENSGGCGNGNSNEDTDVVGKTTESIGLKGYRGNKELRPLRKAIAHLFELQRNSMYNGQSRSQYEKKRQKQKEAHGRKMREAHVQRQYLDKTQLRKGRIDRLQALREEGKDEELALLKDRVERAAALALLVPDGAVDDGCVKKNQLFLENGNKNTEEGVDATTFHDEPNKADKEVGKRKRDPEEMQRGGEDSENYRSSFKRISSNDKGNAEKTRPPAPPVENFNTQLQSAQREAQEPHGDSTSRENDTITGGNGQQKVELPRLRSCYICKARYRELHHFYDQLCPTCAPVNYQKRHATANLDGKIAVVTGCRVKIGFQTSLKLLRAGATVIGTTRFPNAACDVYTKQKDFLSFCSRLHIFGLDLRDVAGIDAFISFVKIKYKKVDVLINNACQTIRRPVGYYTPAVYKEQELFQNANAHHHSLLAASKEYERIRRRRLCAASAGRNSMDLRRCFLLPLNNGGESESTSSLQKTKIETEKKEKSDVTRTIAETSSSSTLSSSLAHITAFETSGVSHSAAMSQLALLQEDVICESSGSGLDPSLLPQGVTDINGQQVDLRTTNSWLLKMQHVSTPEVVETMFINAIAPFILNSKLLPLMMDRATDEKEKRQANARFIINVSAMEGKFYRYKTPNHPHTNMAKAALNMLTRTSSEDLATKHNVFMNSVDTGWINDENPLEKASKIAKTNYFQTPMDEIDAAARIVDPIFTGTKEEMKKGEISYGKFFKDYKSTEW